ncbi:MAG: hypothetical protein HC840_23910 [Leptolyngbyaceae cyanobacterium RM2_2_4]|nr:hypothetical protein [Leptolyngbyaceae cyanobacterium RM2_2_4]
MVLPYRRQDLRLLREVADLSAAFLIISGDRPELQKLEFSKNASFLALAQPTQLNLLIHAQAELIHPQAELIDSE